MDRPDRIVISTSVHQAGKTSKCGPEKIKKLTQDVWKEEYFGETRTLDNHIKRIRQKLGYEDVIKTVFGIGYRLEAPEA